MRLLATLLRPDAGQVSICGVDALAQPRRVRGMIGLTGQFAAVDPVLTGRENLELVAQLYRMGRAAAKQRSTETLERFGLGEVAGNQVKTYSGGMRRRLDLAASVLIRPRVLFLDEPTTGLDLESRRELWKEIRELVAAGTTVLLTTQYLDEADTLADSITVLDNGQTVAQGTPGEIKARVGGDRVEFTLADPAALDRAEAILRDHAGADGELSVDRTLAQVTARLKGDITAVAPMLLALREGGIDIVTHVVRQPTLDDAFLALTGSRIKASGAGSNGSGPQQGAETGAGSKGSKR
ncbi:daunorubicin resistance protein DrrA family ABC transporter ATP-binding protein [Phytohabitans houttuyneae]|uniref:Daunorubicin resistance protein DrrA family ABC transporter ATP-binding protein n=1 Tax=Phytohabitans houttuyneae TaxID=1076126 RepID=A0A6V8KGJ3_9ACTN|nr:daunorubicin resistance protein DrrA family ABC transporter ATP-binding protein [Phytohabitans houttuyneae]